VNYATADHAQEPTASAAPAIAVAEDALASQLERLEHQVERLAHKLQPVLRPVDPHPGLETIAGGGPSVAPLAGVLFLRAGTVERMADLLADLANRCEL
jgi:hypothetical protein